MKLNRVSLLGESTNTLSLLLKRWPIIAIIFFAWLFLGFIIPISVNFLLHMTNNNVYMKILVKHVLPISIFLVFLYAWYKITDSYYKKRAKELFGEWKLMALLAVFLGIFFFVFFLLFSSLLSINRTMKIRDVIGYLLVAISFSISYVIANYLFNILSDLLSRLNLKFTYSADTLSILISTWVGLTVSYYYWEGIQRKNLLTNIVMITSIITYIAASVIAGFI